MIHVVNQPLARAAGWVVFLVACLAGGARAQSTDIALPWPAQTNEVTGAIVARDLGDARLTDHYYAFTGTPGDLLITVEANNLNGDVDVFTSAGLRPLLKIAVYAESSSPVTKSFYLKTRQDLILRVEGRTPNDDQGTYRLQFGGSFEPITSGPLVIAAENARMQAAAPESSSRNSKGRRVSSVGARIEEPAPPPSEVAAAPTPEPTPTESTAAAKTTTKRPTTRTNRVRRPSTTRTRPTQPAKPEETATKTDEAKPSTDETPVPESKPTTGNRRGSRKNTARTVKPPPAQAEPESGPRLLIETSDGTLIDRYMSSVRRVTVENGQVVVVGKDGRTQRVSLANVVRMTITP